MLDINPEKRNVPQDYLEKLESEFKYFDTLLYPLMELLSVHDISESKALKLITALYQQYDTLELFFRSNTEQKNERSLSVSLIYSHF